MPYDTSDKFYAAKDSAREREWSIPNLLPAISEKSFTGIDNVSEDVKSILSNRDLENVAEYLNPSFKMSMPDPYKLKGMEEAVERFVAALQSDESICFYGDYDVDGATSSSILVRHVRMLTGKEAPFYIPDRMKEGYGPNSDAMKKLAKDGIKLLVILDSGTTAFDPVEVAVQSGMDVIIIDHHKSEPRLPSAIVVNPKRQDEDGSLSYLCTAGLAFLFSVAVQRKLRESGFFNGQKEPDLKSLLGIVALGTVADMVPLVELNRAFVKIGLPMMDRNPGIVALKEQNELKDNPYSVYTCGFVFGPCINAGGRIGDTMNGTRLLATDDVDEANRIAGHLCELNKERQNMQRNMVDQALERVTDEEREKGIAIVYDEEWHPGIVGLVASRIKDSLDVSAIVIGTSGKGSARSVDGFDIGQAIIDARLEGVLIAGGGHAAAGGITIDPKRIDDLRNFMAERTRGLERPPIKIDLVAECGSLSVERVKSLDVMEPFGLGNPSPRVAITQGTLKKIQVLKGRHVKGILSGMDGETNFILFNGTDSDLGKKMIAAQGHKVDICGKAKINAFAGKTTVQLHLEDAMIGEATYEN